MPAPLALVGLTNALLHITDHSRLTDPCLPRGEQAATALEANLSKLESKLDELLAGFADPESIRAELAALETEAQQLAGAYQQKNTEETGGETKGPSKAADDGAGKEA